MHFLPEIFSDRGPKPQNRDPILRRPQKPRYPKKQGFTWWWMVKMMVWLTRWWKCRPWQPSIIRKFLANFPLISCLLIFHRSAGGKQKRQTHQRWKSDRRIGPWQDTLDEANNDAQQLVPGRIVVPRLVGGHITIQYLLWDYNIRVELRTCL